jgi:hypothetical protein
MLKKTQQGNYWSARVNDDYRALAIEHEGILTWVWIGKHGEYDRRILISAPSDSTIRQLFLIPIKSKPLNQLAPSIRFN